MRDVFFFTGVGVFALCVLVRTLVVIPWQFAALGMFVAALCFGIAVFESKTEARGLLFAIGCVILFGVVGIVRTSLAPQTIPEEFEPLINTHVSLTGAIVADPDVREKNQQLTVLIEKDNVRTKVLAFARLGQKYTYGEEVTISGLLTDLRHSQLTLVALFGTTTTLQRKESFQTSREQCCRSRTSVRIYRCVR